MQALTVHRALLERWRLAMDLVGPGPVDEHFLDADAAVAGLHAAGDWADLGSGAGFPGIALAAHWPAARVVLVERRQKRVAFLRQVLGQAGLGNAEVRDVDSATLARAAWDGVIARAYKPPAELLAEAATLLRPGGTAVVLTAGDVPTAPAEFELQHVERYEVLGKPRASCRYTRR